MTTDRIEHANATVADLDHAIALGMVRRSPCPLNA